MKKTGEILRKAREEKGLSLNEIGLSLKISSKVLKAIEEGNEKQLPAKTFLRGFVQSYANYLHLDTDQVLEVFYDEMGSTRPKPYLREEEEAFATAADSTSSGGGNNVTPLPQKTKKTDDLAPLRQGRNTKAIVASVLGIILVGLIVFTKRMIDKYSKEAEVPSAEVEQTLEGATPVSTVPESEESAAQAVEPVSSAAPEVTSAPNLAPNPLTTPVETSTPTPTLSPSPSLAAKPSPSPAPSPTPTPVATATPVPSATPTPTPTPTPKPTPEAGMPVELIVEALDNVEIEYSSPNGKTQKIKLSAEQFHTFKSKSGLKINFSNGGAVNLILNGKEVGIPGDLGKPIKLSY